MFRRISRRTMLRGAGSIAIGLPFLNAMNQRASAQVGGVSRFITVYMGTCTGGALLTNPAVAGPLPAVLPLSFASLSSIRQHVSIISKLAMPIHNSSAMPTSPGSAVNIQHGGTISPILTGVSAKDGVAPLPRGHTADQVAADFLGPGSRFASLQLRVQAASYNNRTGAAAQTRGMSVRQSGTTLSELLPIESPLRIFNMLFTTATPTSDAGVSNLDAGISAALLRRKSVLDFVLSDANRLTATVGGEDKARLDQHFTHIRELEQQLVGTAPVRDGGTSVPPMPLACGSIVNPGPDPAITSYDFGSWSEETTRGNNMADLIAYALACDMTRTVSWMLTHDQCWINSQRTAGSTVLTSNGKAEIHNDSHFATNDIKAKNADWGASLFGRLVQNLSLRTEPGGTVLDKTFLSLAFAEGLSAHAKSDLTYVVAGYPSKIKNGSHIVTAQSHPAQIQVAGLKAIGMNTNQLGEVVGPTPGLLV